MLHKHFINIDNLTLRDRLWKFLINNFIESSPFLPPREIPDVRMQLESWGLIEKKNSYKKVEIDNYDLEECEVVLQYPMHIQSYL